VYLELVDEAGGQSLLNHVRAAGDRDVATAGRGVCLLDCGLDPVRHEVELRPARHLFGLPRVVGQDVDRRVEGRLVSPPTV
jgi:hypothetical protein